MKAFGAFGIALLAISQVSAQESSAAKNDTKTIQTTNSFSDPVLQYQSNGAYSLEQFYNVPQGFQGPTVAVQQQQPRVPRGGSKKQWEFPITNAHVGHELKQPSNHIDHPRGFQIQHHQEIPSKPTFQETPIIPKAPEIFQKPKEHTTVEIQKSVPLYETSEIQYINDGFITTNSLVQQPVEDPRVVPMPIPRPFAVPIVGVYPPVYAQYPIYTDRPIPLQVIAPEEVHQSTHLWG